MTYKLTPEMVSEITHVDEVWGTTKLLPKKEDIPMEFWKGNIYTRIADAMFFGSKMPDGEISFRKRFNKDAILRCVRAHLKSWEPKQEHKTAGVGYMLSKMAVITEKKEAAE